MNWICPHCETINPAGQKECEVCQYPVPTWICGKCDLPSPEWESVCLSCSHPRNLPAKPLHEGPSVKVIGSHNVFRSRQPLILAGPLSKDGAVERWREEKDAAWITLYALDVTGSILTIIGALMMMADSAVGSIFIGLGLLPLLFSRVFKWVRPSYVGMSEESHEFLLQREQILGFGFSGDGKRLLVHRDDGVYYSIDLTPGRAFRKIALPPKDPPHSLHISNGKFVILRKGRISICSSLGLEHYSQEFRLMHERAIVIFHSFTQEVWVADLLSNLWSVGSTAVHKFHDHLKTADRILSLDASPVNENVVAGMESGEIIIFLPASGNRRSYKTDAPVESVCYEDSGRFIAAVCGSFIHVFDDLHKKHLITFSHPGRLHIRCISRGRQPGYFLFADDKGVIWMMNISGSSAIPLITSKHAVKQLGMGIRNNFIVWLTVDGNLRIANISLKPGGK